jgi:hypothetical protein
MIQLSVYGQTINSTKVRIWKDGAWRAACLIEGRRFEVSYPSEFGPKFLRFVEDGIYNAYRVTQLLGGK